MVKDDVLAVPRGRELGDNLVDGAVGKQCAHGGSWVTSEEFPDGGLLLIVP